MLEQIGVNSDNFIKFVTTLSLVLFISCMYFLTVNLDSYNRSTIEENLTIAELASDIGYYSGVCKDLEVILKDSFKNGYIEYYNTASKDTPIYFKYYSTNKNTPENKELIDSLNSINRTLAKATYKYANLVGIHKTLEHNVTVMNWFLNSVGIVFMFTFCLGLIVWYRNRGKIDK